MSASAPVPSPPPRLALRLIGAARVTIDDRVVALGSRKALALLALLALDGASPRSRLAALLWPALWALQIKRSDEPAAAHASSQHQRLIETLAGTLAQADAETDALRAALLAPVRAT